MPHVRKLFSKFVAHRIRANSLGCFVVFGEGPGTKSDDKAMEAFQYHRSGCTKFLRNKAFGMEVHSSKGVRLDKSSQRSKLSEGMNNDEEWLVLICWRSPCMHALCR